jgi:hypothetical protein
MNLVKTQAEDGQAPAHEKRRSRRRVAASDLEVECRPGRNAGRIPVNRRRIIGNGDECATHAFGARADAAEGRLRGEDGRSEKQCEERMMRIRASY